MKKFKQYRNNIQSMKIVETKKTTETEKKVLRLKIKKDANKNKAEEERKKKEEEERLRKLKEEQERKKKEEEEKKRKEEERIKKEKEEAAIQAELKRLEEERKKKEDEEIISLSGGKGGDTETGMYIDGKKEE